MVHTDRGGNDPGTWAHWHVALAYAKYLNPQFHVWCNEVVRQRMEGGSASSSAPADVVSIIRTVLPDMMREVVQSIMPAMVRDHVASQRLAVVSGIPASRVLDMAGIIDRKGLKNLPQWVSPRLRRYHAKKGRPVRMGDYGTNSAYIFDELTCREWLAECGQEAIEKKVAERRGQKRLFVVQYRKTGPDTGRDDHPDLFEA